MARPWRREIRVEATEDGGATFEALACGRCCLAAVAMALPGLSGLEALRRLATLGLQRPPLILAIGAKDDVRLKVIATHDLAHAIQELPCPDGVLLRQIWRLVDREIKQHLARLPPLPKALVRVNLHAAGPGRNGRDRRRRACGGERPARRAAAGGGDVRTADGRHAGGAAHAPRLHLPHSLRVATHLATFALATGMRRDNAEILAQAGLLHDIGKAAVPVGILDKPGPLDRGEWHLVQRHPLIAADVLQRSPELPAHLVRIAERHHERLDGSGYPQGLSGAQIDEPSLLCAIADVHTALTDRRAYRSPLNEAAAFARMRQMAGPQLELGMFSRYEAVMLDQRSAARTDPGE